MHQIFSLRVADKISRMNLLNFRDITEFVSNEKAVAATRDQVEAAMRAKTLFLAGASHELRTPLNAIKGFSELMEGELFGPLGNEKYKDYASEISQAADRMLELINHTLESARSDFGVHEEEETQFDLGKALKDTATSLRQMSAVKDISLNLQEITQAILVKGEMNSSRRVMANLIDNAIKYTPPGGRIHCRVGRDISGETWFEVEDTGIGITETDLDQIFNPFYRAGEEARRIAVGTGLGLAIIRAIVERQRGRISVNSQVGTGSTFRVTLPSWRVVSKTQGA